MDKGVPSPSRAHAATPSEPWQPLTSDGGASRAPPHLGLSVYRCLAPGNDQRASGNVAEVPYICCEFERVVLLLNKGLCTCGKHRTCSGYARLCSCPHHMNEITDCLLLHRSTVYRTGIVFIHVPSRLGRGSRRGIHTYDARLHPDHLPARGDVDGVLAGVVKKDGLQTWTKPKPRDVKLGTTSDCKHGVITTWGD